MKENSIMRTYFYHVLLLLFFSGLGCTPSGGSTTGGSSSSLDAKETHHSAGATITPQQQMQVQLQEVHQALATQSSSVNAAITANELANASSELNLTAQELASLQLLQEQP
jgi:hypothetical protein